MNTDKLISLLNAPNKYTRLDVLAELKMLTDGGLLPEPKKTTLVNNHIHTTYSFSPYSPTKAVYMAWQSGLATAGIMDHDSLSGAEEFLRAAALVGMPATVGMECRASMKNTALCGKRINNPDQKSVAYVALHGIPNQSIDLLNGFFSYYRFRRGERNRKMCENINALLGNYGLELDYDNDVLPLSMAHEGGSVTERHILYALAKKITARFDEPEKVVDFLENEMKFSISQKVRGQILSGRDHPEFYEYDILGALKSNMVEKFYIDADAECPDIFELQKVCSACGAVFAYAYLGDVGDSVTGDKKAQKFEDDYLELLFYELDHIGFDAVTYMPSRNSEAQLRRIMELCEKHRFFQISGEDINSPRQSFLCNAMENEMFAHLSDAAYALIGHERRATKGIERAMFSEKAKDLFPDMHTRIEHYKNVVKKN